MSSPLPLARVWSTLFVVLVLLIATPIQAQDADEEIFSGPQAGEKLAGFKVRAVLGENAGKELDLVEQADGKPVTLIFVHELTRPSAALMRLMMEYAAKRSEDGMRAGVVFLSDDATEAENTVKRAVNAMPKGVPITLSLDGQEGPGAYGLNRKVTLTVLVAKDGKVTSNFALVQPSVQADAPKIAKAMVDALGGGEVPTLEQLGAQGYNAAGRRVMQGPLADGELRALLSPLISKQADQEQVDAAAKKVEETCAKRPAVKQQIGDIARRIVNGGKLENYGTAAAQEYITKWAKEFQAPERKENRD